MKRGEKAWGWSETIQRSSEVGYFTSLGEDHPTKKRMTQSDKTPSKFSFSSNRARTCFPYLGMQRKLAGLLYLNVRYTPGVRIF